MDKSFAPETLYDSGSGIGSVVWYESVTNKIKTFNRFCHFNLLMPVVFSFLDCVGQPMKLGKKVLRSFSAWTHLPI